MKILLFKTNITKVTDKQKVENCFKEFQEKIFNWDIDFKDENFTLRVVGSGFTPFQVIEALQKAGFKCEEL
ncbi:MAG: hypothetical protein POELPBGB_01397 [Bacteroidia bacterium]|nr:hypothetical protein [Bacteroidia bacterium]